MTKQALAKRMLALASVRQRLAKLLTMNKLRKLRVQSTGAPKRIEFPHTAVA